jgi:hypothetical protein
MATPIVVGATHVTIGALSVALSATIIGAAVAGVMLAIMAIVTRKGPRQKTATTQQAEAIIKLMQDNLNAYMAGPHTQSSQAVALAAFDEAQAYLFGPEACGAPEMGDPGLRCIFERQPVGTCSTSQADAAHEPLSDCGKYSMSAGLRDPIANDPNVKADPVLGGAGELIDSVTGGIFQSVSGGGSGLLLVAGLAVAAAFMFGGNHK